MGVQGDGDLMAELPEPDPYEVAMRKWDAMTREEQVAYKGGCSRRSRGWRWWSCRRRLPESGYDSVMDSCPMRYWSSSPDAKPLAVRLDTLVRRCDRLRVPLDEQCLQEAG